MKLKNKKTGEIGYPYFQNWKEITCVIVDENAIQLGSYTSLAELNAEWEDAPEEPKERWYINENGGVMKYVPFDPDGEDLSYMKYQNEIGNYFKTKEEAEKAVEKLKAWKRLKDKGFEITYWAVANGNELRFFGHYSRAGIKDDLDLLFGGEE